MMVVERVSVLSNEVNHLELDITPSQLEEINRALTGGRLIQDIVPHLSRDEREFLITGITPQEWMEKFGIDE
mgnify:CR=1 FL=1